MSECDHRQCAICLRRACRSKYVTGFREIVKMWVCRQCVDKAVLWAYECAVKWGGDYGPDICGDKR